jgi:hypothetical protein
MYYDPDFELCQFICNRGKHLKVTREPIKTAETRGDVGWILGTNITGLPRFQFLLMGKKSFLRN